MGLARVLVDIYGVSAAIKNVSTTFAKAETAHLTHHVKTSSLLNPTKTIIQQSPPASQSIDSTVESRSETVNATEPGHNDFNIQEEGSNVLLNNDVSQSGAKSQTAFVKQSSVPPAKPNPVIESKKIDIMAETSPAFQEGSIKEDTTNVSQADPTLTPAQEIFLAEATSIEAATLLEEEGERRVLKSSRIPTSRTSRLWHYGSLATAMGFGAMNESLKRMTGISKGEGGVMLSEKNVDRLVEKLSRMRGAALKMGQMLSIQGIQAANSGQSMLPPQLEQVLLRVHDSANYMPEWQMEKVMKEQLGNDWNTHFSSFDPIPIAAASIGQVHAATLASTGMPLAIKIQYPGIRESIDSDLNNLKTLVTFSNLLPKGLYLDNTIRVTKQELAWECDYEREADNAIRFKNLLNDDVRYKVPAVVKELSTSMVLVTERLRGQVLSKALSEPQELRNKLGENLLRLCLREVFSFKFMQTDPNWSNFFYNTQSGQIELLDFGACREFPSEFLSKYGKILLSASRGEREGVWQYSKDLGFVTGYETAVMKEAHIDSVMVLGEPFRSDAPDMYDFSTQTVTARVRDTIPVMLRHRLTPPPDETYGLHKKLSGAFLLCTKLGSTFDTKRVWREEVLEHFQVV
ncbi:ABC1 family-domain-containing protein [Umbelopsis sp. PMI_123]|nr:ABC1 family-domain-containing protein [Umbelopsis sp. PMI_123]